MPRLYHEGKKNSFLTIFGLFHIGTDTASLKFFGAIALLRTMQFSKISAQNLLLIFLDSCSEYPDASKIFLLN